MEQGLIDRPIEIIYREVEGLPKGSVKAVIDAYGELVDEGCLAVFGPHITDNCVPTREAIEERFKVPAISVTGTDDWLGEWTFSFPMGSTDRRADLLGDLLAKGGHTEVGVLVEQSLVGDTYVKNFRNACRAQGHSHRRRSVDRADRAGRHRSGAHAARSQAEALVHCGFGFGIVFINPALEALDWDPPRFTSTAFQNAWINPIMWNAFMGWIGRRPVRRGQPGRPGRSSTSTRRSTAASPGVLRAGGEPRRRRPRCCTPSPTPTR